MYSLIYSFAIVSSVFEVLFLLVYDIVSFVTFSLTCFNLPCALTYLLNLGGSHLIGEWYYIRGYLHILG